jgi:hypothetical protein
MRNARWVGVVGAVVFTIGFFLLSAIPGGGEPDPSDFQDFYVEDDRTELALVAVYAMTLGALAMLWFFHELREAMPTWTARLGFASSALGLSLAVAGAAIMAGPSGVQSFGDGAFVGEPVAHAMSQAGWGVILVGGALFLGLGIAGFALGGRQTAALPSWVVITGFVAAALQLVAVIWFPALAIPLWVILAAVGGVRATAARPALAD